MIRMNVLHLLRFRAFAKILYYMQNPCGLPIQLGALRNFDYAKDANVRSERTLDRRIWAVSDYFSASRSSIKSTLNLEGWFFAEFLCSSSAKEWP